jgi:alcohol dehydrogenase
MQWRISLGGFYDLPHGVCNAVLLPHVQVFNSKVAAARCVTVQKQWAWMSAR